MKNIMAITFGLLLLVSSAAAEGNSNVANVATTDSMTGQIITNANFAQANDIDANLNGNSINANQLSNIGAFDNTLAGSKPDGKTFFFQSVDQSISDTGNSNVDAQIVGGLISAGVTGINSIDSGLIATGNTLTDSAASQIIGQSENIEGNSNVDTQIVGGPIGVGVTGINTISSGLIAAGNTLTDSVSNQIIGQNENTEGNSNIDTQNVGGPIGAGVSGINSIDSGLIAAGNTLTNSISNQIIGQSENIEGNSNVDTQNVGGPISVGITGINTISSGLIAAGNTLTDSAVSQIIGQSQNVEGNSNIDTQNVGGPISAGVSGINTIDSGLIAAGNTLTGSVVSQIIGQSQNVEGNSNLDTQNVGGPISVGATGINTIDSGLIAAGNTLTDSAASQIIGQNDTDIGNTNVVTQLANTIMTSDILTESGALQKTDENVHSLGNANAFSQNEALASTANTVTGGIILQQADVSTNI